MSIEAGSDWLWPIPIGIHCYATLRRSTRCSSARRGGAGRAGGAARRRAGRSSPATTTSYTV